MPAWMTSELRELVWVPIASSASRITTSRPDTASARATARPTTPAPTTTASTRSTSRLTRHGAFEEECAEAGSGGQGCQGARRAVECGAQPGADQRAASEADGADQRTGAAGGLGESGKGRGQGLGESQPG